MENMHETVYGNNIISILSLSQAMSKILTVPVLFYITLFLYLHYLSLHLFDQKYNKDSSIMKHYYTIMHNSFLFYSNVL